MESINRIQAGVHSDFNEEMQPQGTLRYSLNGRFVAHGHGQYTWTNMKGTVDIFSAAGQILQICELRNKLYFFSLTGHPGVALYVVELNATQIAISSGPTLVRLYYNSDFKYDPAHPIRAMWGYYENEETQRIYFSDFHNQPRVIDLVNPQTVKFIDFSPVHTSENEFELNDVLAGGSLRYGAYFIAYRLFDGHGYYTDWSFHTNPINVGQSSRGTTPDDYHNYTGGAFTQNSGNRINITIRGIDTDYEKIQICYFLASGLNSSEPGIICYDDDVTSSVMTFDILGSETLGAVEISDLILMNIAITRCKDMFPTKGYNTIYNIEERPELDLGSSIAGTISAEKYEVVLDSRGSTGPSTNSPITSVPKLAGTGGSLIYGGWWYRANSSGSYTTTATGTVHNFTSGSRFRCLDRATVTSGTLTPIIRIKKYRYGTATAPYSDSDYEWLEIDATGFFPNYKDPIISHFLKGYACDVKVRWGILFYDLMGKPFYVRHILDWTPPSRNSFGITTPYGAVSGSPEGADYNQINGNVLSFILGGIDITSIRTQISGFSFVRAIIPDVKVGTGILHPMYYNAGACRAWTGFHGNFLSTTARKANAYNLYCPESQFGMRAPQVGDKIKNVVYMSPLAPTASCDLGQGWGKEDCSGSAYSPNYKTHQKFYVRNITTPSSGNGMIGSENRIEQLTNYEFLDHDILFDIGKPADLYKDRSASVGAGTPGNGMNSRSLLVMTGNNESSGSNPNFESNLAVTNSKCLIVDIMRGTADYGGTDEASLALTEYMTVGHYQVVDTAFLADINDGAGNFVINGVQVFGGDHYVCLYGHQKVIANENDTDKFSLSFVVPLETKVNLALRQGRKFEQLQTVDSSAVPDGLRYNSATPTVLIEEYIINHAYGSDRIGDIYPGVPYDQSLASHHDSMARFSEHKVAGEKQDSFRIFRTNNYRSLEGTYGPITGAAPNGGYVVVWQPDAVSYIPISERQMSAGEFGQPVQLGVGEMFQIDDQIIEKIGNSHQFGLIKHEGGFLWFDAKRSIALKMDRSMKISKESIIAGFSDILDAKYDRSILGSDNPLAGYGICAGYEPHYGCGYLSFVQASNSFTLGFDLNRGLYLGEYSFILRATYPYKEVMLSLDGMGLVVHDKGNYGRFYNSARNSELSVIIKDETGLAMKFDNLVMGGNGKNFDVIEFTNYAGTVTETISTVAGLLSSRNYRLIRNELRGSIPLLNHKRFDGAWLKITFRVSSTRTDNTAIRFFQLLTKSRNGW